MTDIVERLRSYAHPNSWTASISEMLNEAADEIARLTRERQHLEHQLSLGEQLNDRLTREQVQPRAHDCALARELRFEIALLNAEIGGLKADVERLTRERDDTATAMTGRALEIVRLRAALGRIIKIDGLPDDPGPCGHIAIAALSHEQTAKSADDGLCPTCGTILP